jgi:hypothetical protein
MSRIAVALIVTIVSCSCGSTKSFSSSFTPRITDNPTSALRLGLLAAADLNSVSGIPTVSDVPVAQSAIFANPDPRAPCGAKLAIPKISDAIAEFSSQTGNAFEALGRVSARTASDLFEANRADMRSGCPPYETQTNHAGVTQRVAYQGSVPLGSVPDDAIAVRLQITNGPVTVDGVFIFIHRRDVLIYFVYFGDGALSGSSIADIAALASKHLDRVA